MQPIVKGGIDSAPTTRNDGDNQQPPSTRSRGPGAGVVSAGRPPAPRDRAWAVAFKVNVAITFISVRVAQCIPCPTAVSSDKVVVVDLILVHVLSIRLSIAMRLELKLSVDGLVLAGQGVFGLIKLQRSACSPVCIECCYYCRPRVIFELFCIKRRSMCVH